jgi:hypothetical protein
VELDEAKGRPGAEQRRGGSRNIDGFEGVYRASYPKLVGQLYVVTTSRAEAEEVVQEAFARLWARWDQVGGYEKIEAWGAARRSTSPPAAGVALGASNHFTRSPLRRTIPRDQI